MSEVIKKTPLDEINKFIDYYSKAKGFAPYRIVVEQKALENITRQYPILEHNGLVSYRGVRLVTK